MGNGYLSLIKSNMVVLLTDVKLELFSAFITRDKSFDSNEFFP